MLCDQHSQVPVYSDPGLSLLDDWHPFAWQKRDVRRDHPQSTQQNAQGPAWNLTVLGCNNPVLLGISCFPTIILTRATLNWDGARADNYSEAIGCCGWSIYLSLQQADCDVSASVQEFIPVEVAQVLRHPDVRSLKEPPICIRRVNGGRRSFGGGLGSVCLVLLGHSSAPAQVPQRCDPPAAAQV